MKVLHTSDWHLGKTLYSKKDRQDEHIAFLDWLSYTIEQESIDLLIIAGDIFDTSSPSSSSQKIYYDFLIKVKMLSCKNIVVIGGNHDSPSFLNATKDILSVLNIKVIGNASKNIEDEIIIINDINGKPQLIVCGVPFLRERDISHYVEGDNYSDRSRRINENIKKHYEEIAIYAEKKRNEFAINVPIIATGHLSVAGGQRNDDDGVRETYIGNIEAVGSDIFPKIFDYVALGHYHIPSKIKDNIRYCGSPIPMGFGEANHSKCVYIIDFVTDMTIKTVEIPVFQRLESIVGNKYQIENRITELLNENYSVWVEVIYNGDVIFPDFSTWINELVKDTKIEVLKMQNRQYLYEVLCAEDSTELLDELEPIDVFDKFLDKTTISEDQKRELKESYKEIIDGLNIEENNK